MSNTSIEVAKELTLAVVQVVRFKKTTDHESSNECVANEISKVFNIIHDSVLEAESKSKNHQ